MNATRDDPDAIDPDDLGSWLTLVRAPDGQEHAVLSDGRHHIRVDVIGGTLAGRRRVVLHYEMHGLESANRRVLPLRRFLHLCRHRRFSASLFPAERGTERGILLLRVRDALDEHASQREIARALFGERRVESDWQADSDSLRSQLRRLVREARALSAGGYRYLLRRRDPQS